MNTFPLSPWLTRTHRPQSPLGLTLVVAAHFAIVWAALHSRGEPIISPPQALQVRLITPERTELARPQTAERAHPVQRAPASVLATPRETASAMVAPMPAAVSEAPQPAKTEVLAAAPAAALTPPRFDANYLDNPVPVYPALARRLGEEGRVSLRVFVGIDGLPAKIELHQSSGYSRLDSVARETVRRWRFAPARLGDERIGAWVVVPISFSLRS
ncbi:MAG: energy transducer TonB [Burkholderiales bacterium]|nr:energy transducer TonB [Burkholderiales bacterium]